MLLFRDVVGVAEQILKAQDWLGRNDEVILIRDFSGCLRFVLKMNSRANTAQLKKQLHDLRLALSSQLGHWLATEDPVRCLATMTKPTALDKKLMEYVDANKGRSFRDEPCALFIMDRHVAKHGWVGHLERDPDWSLARVDERQMPAIVVFFSHKGGVGRSTALVATALNLARRGRKVVAIDLDLEAPGLSTVLLNSDPSPGLVDWLVNPNGSYLGTLPRSIHEPQWIGEHLRGRLRLLPAGRLDSEYLQMLARLDLQTARGPQSLRERLSQLFKELRQQEEPEIFLVDARAGLHDVGGVLLSSLCHLAIFVGTLSEQSMFGLQTVASALSGRHSEAAIEPIPLRVVHGMSYEKETHRTFAGKVYDILCDYYFPRGAVPPDREGDVIRLPFDPRLLGQGGYLQEEVVEVLTTGTYVALADWIEQKFMSDLSARAN